MDTRYKHAGRRDWLQALRSGGGSHESCHHAMDGTHSLRPARRPAAPRRSPPADILPAGGGAARGGRAFARDAILHYKRTTCSKCIQFANSSSVE